MRINKYIAKSGYTSRRKADLLIEQGKVYINGKKVIEKGIEVKENDKVSIDGTILNLSKNFYLKLYKPIGYITSNYDPYNNKDLTDLVSIEGGFHAAGRLDKDSEGLLIITNDGEFTNNIIHPSKKLDKEYIVKVDKKLSINNIEKFEKGLDIGRGEITSNSNIKLINEDPITYNVIIHQGFNRQIRRMFDVFNIKVLNLKRIRIGDINLDNMKAYDCIKFNDLELEFVKKIRG